MSRTSDCMVFYKKNLFKLALFHLSFNLFIQVPSITIITIISLQNLPYFCILYQKRVVITFKCAKPAAIRSTVIDLEYLVRYKFPTSKGSN